MKAGDLTLREFRNHLKTKGLLIQFGPFNIRMRSDLAAFATLAHQLYQLYPLSSPIDLIDFHVEIKKARGFRRWVRPQAIFALDGQSPFAPYRVDHALPALEWGINWCIATRAHHFLMLHAAVVERNGLAMLLPAWPGHGKSTLCAALIHSGWRLLSDEFGLVQPEDGKLIPIPRLIPLKNESIAVIKQFRPEAVIGPSFLKTRKGTVAHVRPPEESILRAQDPAEPRWLVFPRWVAEAPLAIEPIPKSEAFLLVATNAFNYEILDATAFRLVTEIVKKCDCYSLVYSNLAEAMSALDALTSS